MLPNIGHYTFTYFAWVNLLSILKSVKDKCNRTHSRSKEKCYFILYLFCNRESCCINSRSIRARHCMDGKIQRLLARPPNSKLIINICFISGPKAAKLPKFLYSKFQNCFWCVYIYVFSAPRRLIAIFCLFSCFLLVIHSRTSIGSADWGAVRGQFFFSCYVLLGLCPHLQLSPAKETNTADTVKLPRKYLCGGQLQVWVHTR